MAERGSRSPWALLLVASLPLLSALTRPTAGTGSFTSPGRDEVARLSVRADTQKTHDELRRYMVEFFRAWRAEWLLGKTQLRRPPVVLSPEDNAAFIELDIVRRSLGFCPAVVRMPPERVAYRFQDNEFSVPRYITGPLGQGSGTRCVDWLPAQEQWEDESEDMDLAVAYARRPKVRMARTMLLRFISSASRKNPEDTWITGQFVRFLIDQRQLDSAAGVASRCRGDVAFCESLVGLTQYRRNDLVAAEVAFRRVDSLHFATAWVGDTCEAPELDMLRARRSREVRAMSCDTRATYIERLWWLSDPLWSDSGNLRFVEHHARRTMLALHTVTDEDERFTWGRVCAGLASRALVMRYGWPSHVWFDSTYQFRTYKSLKAQACPDMPRMSLEYMISRVPLVPDWEAILEPFTATSANWLLERPAGVSPQGWWPVEHMPLKHALRPMPEGQLAYFRRDTMVQLALAIDGPTATLRPNMANAALSVLVASTGPRHRAILDQREMLPDETLRWAGMVSGAPMVLSAELLGRIPEEPNQRLRLGTRPPAPLSRMAADSIGVSDPVLLATPAGQDIGALPFDGVLATLRGSTIVSPGETITMYWESYGVSTADTVDVDVRLLERARPGAVRRVGALICIGTASRDSVTVSWREPARAHPVSQLSGHRGVLGRTLALRLAAADPGEYDLVVEMRRMKGSVQVGTARGARTITVLPPAGR